MKEHKNQKEILKENRELMLKEFEQLELDLEHCVDVSTECEAEVIGKMTYFLRESKRFFLMWLRDDEKREAYARETVEFFDNPGIYFPDADDLKDAAPRFFRWMEELAHTSLQQDEVEPLLPVLVGWPAPAVVRALERWSAIWWFSRDFRGKAAETAAAIRAMLRAEGAAVTPSPTSGGTGSEPAPAVTLPTRHERSTSVDRS